MKQEPIFFTNSRGQRLSGVFHIPDGKGPFPVVIYLHGYQSDKASHKILAIIEKLPSIVGFRYDATGHGESEGDFAETTVSQWVADMNSAIELVKKQPFVDKTRIALYGSSLGGMAVLLTASVRDDIACITPICPVSKFAETTKRRSMTSGENMLWKQRGYKTEFHVKRGAHVKINYAFYEDGISHDVYAAAERIRCPGLVVHGTADPVVQFDQSVELVKHNKLLQLCPVEGADHLFSETDHYHTIVAVVAYFFKKNLSKR